jgi:hypothetical protein
MLSAAPLASRRPAIQNTTAVPCRAAQLGSRRRTCPRTHVSSGRSASTWTSTVRAPCPAAKPSTRRCGQPVRRRASHSLSRGEDWRIPPWRTTRSPILAGLRPPASPRQAWQAKVHEAVPAAPLFPHGQREMLPTRVPCPAARSKTRSTIPAAARRSPWRRGGSLRFLEPGLRYSLASFPTPRRLAGPSEDRSYPPSSLSSRSPRNATRPRSLSRGEAKNQANVPAASLPSRPGGGQGSDQGTRRPPSRVSPPRGEEAPSLSSSWVPGASSLVDNLLGGGSVILGGSVGRDAGSFPLFPGREGVRIARIWSVTWSRFWVSCCSSSGEWPEGGGGIVVQPTF